MQGIYFDVLPRDITKIILLWISDKNTFENLYDSGINSLTFLLTSKDFWKSKVRLLFPKGGDEYISPYYMIFNDDIDINIMKYKILNQISSVIDEVLSNYYTVISNKSTKKDRKFLIFECHFKFINNYDCLKLDSLPTPIKKQMINSIMVNGSFMVIFITSNPLIYQINFGNLAYGIDITDVKNIIGHIISNGGEFNGRSFT